MKSYLRRNVMKRKLYEKYSEEIPSEATQIISSLCDPKRRAILVLLSKHGELSFSEIQNELAMSKLTLNYHLKDLYSRGLTDHYFRHELGNQKYSYYSITALGKRVLFGIVNALIPPMPITEKWQSVTSEKYELIPRAQSVSPAIYLFDKKNRTAKTVPSSSCSEIKTSEPSDATNRATYTRA
jgi:DNA-binding transcriptional ArsR family regulator